MKTINLTITIFALFTLISCSSYVNRWHQEFDRGNGQNQRSEYDKFQIYRQQKMANAKRNILSTRNKKQLPPSVQRSYQADTYKKRYKSDDLNDNSNDASLWNGQRGNDNFLFTKKRTKKNGDIVLIQVYTRMKNEISAELKRAFPEIKKNQKKDAVKAGAPTVASSKTAAPPEEPTEVSGSKMHDRISSVVIEEINQDHLLLRGRKNLLYKKRKRLIEIQALVSRKDVSDEDTINSDNILEHNITVLR